MSARITRRPAADRDLLQQADYLCQQSGLETAHRFLDAAETTFRSLAASPQLGSRCHFRRAEAQGLLVWWIEGFPKHLIFYRPSDDGIEVIRVIHSARDIDRVLGESEA